jgi:hypothetical protein
MEQFHLDEIDQFGNNGQSYHHYYYLCSSMAFNGDFTLVPVKHKQELQSD